MSRKRYTTATIIEGKVIDFKARAKDPSQREQGLTYSCAVIDLRKIQHQDGKRALCVVDRALLDEPCHAESWGTRKLSPSKLGLLRDQIVGLLNAGERTVVDVS